MDETELLLSWRDTLSGALGIDASALDIPAVLALAKATAPGVARPAVPLTACLVGLATASAVTRGTDPAEAFADAVGTATSTIAAWAEAHPATT